MSDVDERSRDIDPVTALDGLAALARTRLPPVAAAGESADAYARLQRAMGRGETHVRWRARGLWVASAAALAVAAWVVLIPMLRRPAPASISVRVEQGVLAEGGYVRAASADGESRLQFSDGTEVGLAPASRARVAETDDRGARVLLEEGRARAHVVHRPRSRWIFDAGPCRVRVTGTRFDMRWSPARQVLEVRLYEGGVTVEGPPAIAGVTMRAGQLLVMDVRRGLVRFGGLDEREGPPERPQEGPVEGPPAAPVEGPVESAGVQPAPGRRDEGPRSTAGGAGGWQARVLAGDFRGVVRDAQRRGIDRVLRREPAPSLMALADAARYAGGARLATRALARVRDRFPDTAPAHRAAFLLGRLAEDQGGDLPRALDWYRIYLADVDRAGRAEPDAGAFRAEALGRQMGATLRLRGVERARPLAAEYLRRYPRGAYVSAARKILAPSP